MATTPVSIFTPIADPDEVLAAIRHLAPDAYVDVEPARGAWRSVTIPWDDAERWPLRINHSPDYYEEPGWSSQLAGLLAFLGRFPRHERTEEVLATAAASKSAYGVALSCLLDLDLSVDEDPRLAVLHAVTEAVDGVLFTPEGLRDGQGRVLIGEAGPAAGAVVPNAVPQPVAPPPEPELVAPPPEPEAEQPEPEAEQPEPEAEQPEPEAEQPEAVVPEAVGPAAGPVAEPEPAPEPAPVPGPGPEAVAPTAVVVEPVAPPIDFSPPKPVVDLRSDPTPAPDARRVALRSLALAAVCSRAFLEQDDPDEVDQEHERQQIEQWALTVDGLDQELEPDEWQILQSGIEMLDDRLGVDAAWRIEGLAVLAWALGLIELPAYDALADSDRLNEVIGYLDPVKANEVVGSAQLHAHDRLVAVQRQARAVHWRLREFRLQPGPIDFLTHATDSLLGDLDVSWCRFAGDDLAVAVNGHDVAIADADDDVVDQVQSVAYERFLAATWLLEGGTYSTVQVSV